MRQKRFVGFIKNANFANDGNSYNNILNLRQMKRFIYGSFTPGLWMRI